ncbi:single-stranded DNA-binding protein [Rossellomorea vietnamensis]|uniref:Single-stranded DNA-binding protein n=1 Tax=Rossellomorea vietnamensis TaxID=218284 RepID=A0A6I6UX00_9BACI|nr:single-stranded DNA-binding protein [Rossellomorea vietnamensis]QHE63400.1 single-stranded DNA-binding protein [Rossellomorea vietnamensis]
MINQVTLVGRLTKDPEARKTMEGKSVLSVTIAVNRPYKNQQGQIDADFVLCTIWNRAADNTEKYCRKGSVVGVTGRIQTRYFENDQGKRTYITEVVAENIRFLDSKQASPVTPEPSKKEPIELPF